MSDLVDACPECDSTKQLYTREFRGHLERTDETNRYRCGVCGAEFGNPHQRPPKHPPL